MFFAKLATIAALALGAYAQTGNLTIVELALGDSDLSTLVKVLTSSTMYAPIISALNGKRLARLF